MWIATYRPTCCLFSEHLRLSLHSARPPTSLTHISSAPRDQKKPTYSLIIVNAFPLQCIPTTTNHVQTERSSYADAQDRACCCQQNREFVSSRMSAAGLHQLVGSAALCTAPVRPHCQLILLKQLQSAFGCHRGRRRGPVAYLILICISIACCSESPAMTAHRDPVSPPTSIVDLVK